MIKTYVQTIGIKKSAVIFPPAAPEDIERISRFFNSNIFSELPEDYYKFLAVSDGLIYNGIEFFGTQPHQRIEQNYTFPDLESANTQYLKYNFFSSKAVIGRLSEGIIYYDTKGRCYAISDRLNLRSHTEINSFDDLFKVLFGL